MAQNTRPTQGEAGIETTNKTLNMPSTATVKNVGPQIADYQKPTDPLSEVYGMKSEMKTGAKSVV